MNSSVDESRQSELQIQAIVAKALNQGDVALWLGPDWICPEGEADLQPILAAEWLAIWSESKATELAAALRASWSQPTRLLIEVPSRIEDSLGSHFLLSDTCPFFYLAGVSEGGSVLSDRQRRMARDEQVDVLGRLGSSTLIIAGYDDPEGLGPTLLNEITEAGPNLRNIVYLSAGAGAALAASPHRQLPSLYISSLDLSGILGAAAFEISEASAAPAIRVGSQIIGISRIARTEPPIDQEFYIPTLTDTRAPERSEEFQEIMFSLLKGVQPPWRAFAHSLNWQRHLPYQAKLEQCLMMVRATDPVVCMNIPAEAGSGLTTVLQEAAFRSAQAGYPAMLYRRQDQRPTVQLLRTYLRELYEEAGSALQDHPVVLLFDRDAVETDTEGVLNSLPQRLRKDGFRALLVRGLPLREGEQYGSERYRTLHRTDRLTPNVWAEPLTSFLSLTDQESLAQWVQDLGYSPGQVTAVRSWNQSDTDAPLLVCLHFILTGDLRSAAALGRHLFDRFWSSLPPQARRETSTELEQGALRGPALESAVSRLRRHFAERFRGRQVRLEEVAATFIMLAAAGTLRIPISRSVLEEVVAHGAERLDINAVLALLEKSELVAIDVQSLNDPVSGSANFAPAAFYHREEYVGIKHPAYGKMIFDWLTGEDGRDARLMLPANALVDEVLEAAAAGDYPEEYPVGLLRPLLARLKPLPSHVKLAEEISTRFLRLQRKSSTGAYSAWQWSNPERIRAIFASIPEQVLRQSSVLLHSRGITTYKATGGLQDATEWRQQYREAESDFKRGIQLARTAGASSENPANILTSLGLLYQWWSQRELESGDLVQARELDRQTVSTLRQALAERSDNPYAAHGLARYLVQRCQRALTGRYGRLSDEEFGDSLAEAVELLQQEPEGYFQVEWEETRATAIGLLGKAKAVQVIDRLKAQKKGLGLALEALQELGGMIPTEIVTDPVAVAQMEGALEVLRASAEGFDDSALVKILEYALFRAHPDRLVDLAFGEQFKLLERLAGTNYLEQPLYLYDFAMLCFQVGEVDRGEEAFRRLRAGQRYYEVPTQRTQFLLQPPDWKRKALAQLRVVDIGAGGRGWGIVEHPYKIPGRVRLAVQAFLNRNIPIVIGGSVACHIRLDAPGPFAVPQQRLGRE